MGDETAVMPVGVIVERIRIDNPWREFDWRVVAVVPGAPEVDAWTPLQTGDQESAMRWHAATLPLTLHRGETQGYKVNLSNRAPAVYVISRIDDDDPDAPPIAPFVATVCSYEAAAYADSGDDLVDATAMPPGVRAWLMAYCEQHHVDEVFVKRQRKPYDPRKGGPGRGVGAEALDR
ncbi:MAG: DUF3305 domain-containing protein [Pseudomonadota bacterium]